MIPDVVPPRTGPGRALPITLGAVLIVVSALVLLTSLDRATIVYSLPPNPMQGESNRHEVIWPPGVVASVLAGLGLLGAFVLLLLGAARKLSGWRWLVPAVLVVVALVAAVVVGGLPMPAF